MSKFDKAVTAATLGAVGCLMAFLVASASMSRPAAAQLGPVDPVPFVVAGGLDGGRWAYRVWSDGVVELNDTAGQTGNGDELFKGWREVK